MPEPVYPDSYPPHFLARVALPPPERRDTDCWTWVGPLNRHGFGKGVNKLLAHHWSYVLHYGPVGPRQHVRHTCTSRDCVNPRHLELVPEGERHDA